MMVSGETMMDDCIVKPPESAVATPLSAIVEAFEELSKKMKERKEGEEMRLDTFCEASSLVSILFRSLGLAFKFAELEYVAKLHGLLEASKTCHTLQDILDLDVASDTVKTSGSCSRNLRRVRQGLDLVRVIFEQLLSTDDSSLKEVASTAYGQVCAPYHTWAVRTAVYAGMYTLPTRDQLLVMLNETEQSAEKKMRRAPPATFPRAVAKIPTITLPEDAFVKKFYKKYPDSKYHDAIKFCAFDPPPSRIFALRVLELKEQGIGEEQAMAVADMEYLAEKKAKKKAYARLKQIARLQGKRLPPNPYPSPIKEIQAEEKKYVRDRFFNPKILEIVKQKKAEAMERFRGGNDW